MSLMSNDLVFCLKLVGCLDLSNNHAFLGKCVYRVCLGLTIMESLGECD